MVFYRIDVTAAFLGFTLMDFLEAAGCLAVGTRGFGVQDSCGSGYRFFGSCWIEAG